MSAVDLRANAIITAVDRFSGPIRNMAGSVDAITRRADAVAHAARRTGSALAGPMAMGLGAVIYRTQEFEKKALGARIATVADAMERVTDEFGRDHILVDHAKIAREGEAIKNAALATSKLLGVSPTGLMEAAEAAAKMGIELKKSEAVMRTSAILKMADPDIGYGRAAEFMGTLGKQFKAPSGTDEYAKWIYATGDKIATVASATKTTVSKLEDGFRQFAGTYATFGATLEQSAALIGGMVQGGLADAESGTALKSAGVRFVRPTLEGLSAMSAIGVDRRNYMNLTGADPRRAMNQLTQQFGFLSKKDKAYLRGQLEQAQKEGKGAEPEVLDRVATYINKKNPGKENYEDTLLKVLNTITTSGGKVDIFKFLGDIAKGFKEGKVSPAQLATIFEGKHLARMMTLIQMWGGEVEKLISLLGRVSGQGLDATHKQYSASSYGQWETAMAAFDRALIRLRESEGIRNIIMMTERFANAVASMDQGKVEVVGQAVAALLALGGAGAVLGGIASGLTALKVALTHPIAGPLLAIAAAVTVLYDRLSDDTKKALWEQAKRPFTLSPEDMWGGTRPSDRLPPLAKTTDDLIRAISQPLTGEARVRIDVDFHGLPEGMTAKQRGSAEVPVPLRSGTSMGDLAIP